MIGPIATAVSEVHALGLGAVLGPLGIDGFRHPHWIPLLLVLAMAVAAASLRRRPAALPWPALVEARTAGARSADPVRLAALTLRVAALVALAGVLAGPVSLRQPASREAAGLDLVLALDVSPSMRALDTSRQGEPRTRLELAREAVARFAARRAAEGDRVGLVLFGKTAFTRTPLTRDGALLGHALEQVEAGVAGDATALGDALALAVRRALGGAELAGGEGGSAAAPEAGTPAGPDPPGGAPARPGPGRVVVLLTDGRSNAGRVPVDLAAELARTAGVRVHTVGIGTGGRVPVETPGQGLRYERHDLDARALEHVAARTGGELFRARRSADLEAVYAAIDGLERVARELPPQPRRVDRPRPLLAGAGFLLLAEIGLARVARRRLP